MKRKGRLYYALDAASLLLAVSALFLGHWWFWLFIGAGAACVAVVNYAMWREGRTAA